MDVENFGEWKLLLSTSMLPQTVEFQVIVNVFDVTKALVERFRGSTDSPVFPIELDAHDC
jgi:hypothetical protein